MGEISYVFPNQIEYIMDFKIRQMEFLLNYKPVIVENLDQPIGIIWNH